jgi:transposase
MPQNPLAANKVRALLRLCHSDAFNKSRTAKELRIARNSASKYIRAFRCSELSLSDIAHVGSAGLAKLLFPDRVHARSVQSDRKVKLFDRFASIHRRIEEDRITVLDAWREHVASKEPTYQYSQFVSLYGLWRHQHGFPRYSRVKRHGLSIEPADFHVLNRWRVSHDRRKWEVGIALQSLSAGENISAICRKLDRAQRTVENWCLVYEREGIKGLPLGRFRKLSEDSVAAVKSKTEKLIKIIHESPKAYDINRASWSLQALADAYYRTYGERISMSSISEYFIASGYKFKKAKKVLTSSDPNYRDKLIKITETLSQLPPNEKFFSIDEFGPFSVKIRGGTALVAGDTVRTIPQRQKSKGSLICTAALELSTNQVTHFYSTKKNTREMVRLLKRLIIAYKNEHRLYASWDSASWHASKALYEAVDGEPPKTPDNSSVPPSKGGECQGSCRRGSVTILLLPELSYWRLGEPALRTCDW